MKSLAMLKFNRISPSADFYSKLLLEKLDITNKNVLYCTHELDKIKKIVTTLANSSNLQKQVDEYFEDDETSPQTDSDDK